MANTVTVKKGDTLSAIAAKAGISLSALIKLNPQISNPSLIKPGQVVTTAASTPTTSKAAPAGNNDAQNAARIEAELIASDKAAAEEAKKAYALSPAGIAAANAAYNAANPPAATTVVTPTPIATPTPIVTPTTEVDNFQESIDAAAKINSTPDPDSIDFTSLTPEQQTAISGIGEQGLDVTKNLTTQATGSYKQDIATGLLSLNGQPYNGSYNGFDYVDGAKVGATTKEVVNLDFENKSTFSITGSDPTDTSRADAYAVIKMILNSYGLGDELGDELIGYMNDGKGPEEAMLLIKQNPKGAYKKRFAGNELRIAAGLNVLTEDAYLKLEDAYAETLRAYGLGNMLSTDRKQNEAMFAKYMGNDLNAPEFKERIQLATDRVINADAMTKGIFKQFYPSLTDADLVAYFLAPKDTLSKLQEKVTSAEIGSAAVAQGLETSMASATELAKFGIDKNAAIQGYANVKEALPTTQKLGDIYGETGIKYDQATGEAEFLKGNQDAAQKRKRLKSLERASFQGESGISQGSGLVRSVQGKF